MKNRISEKERFAEAVGVFVCAVVVLALYGGNGRIYHQRRGIFYFAAFFAGCISGHNGSSVSAVDLSESALYTVLCEAGCCYRNAAAVTAPL